MSMLVPPKALRAYNPSRDLAHLFDGMALAVAARLEDQPWPYLRDFLAREGVTLDDLGDACRFFCRYVAEPDQGERIDQALTRCGWFDVPEPAQFAYLAVLGTVVLGYARAGVREATASGDGPALSREDLRAAGEATAKVLAMPRWRRRLLRWRRRLTRT